MNKLAFHVPTSILVVDGQTSESQLNVLAQLASEVPPDTVIVEIGGFRGRSALALAYGSSLGNRVPVYSVDPHDDFNGPCGHYFTPLDGAEFMKNVGGSPYGALVKPVFLSSVQASRSLSYEVGWGKTSSGKVGLLFIDGNHDSVGEDLDVWDKWVIEGGAVVLHDTNYGPVQKTCEELVRCNSVYGGEEGNMRWYFLP